MRERLVEGWSVVTYERGGGRLPCLGSHIVGGVGQVEGRGGRGGEEEGGPSHA